jgi:isocitrate dehydrogenase kinase/phosphatase
VFPETFGPFLLGDPGVREVFMRHHADLLDASFWNAHKDRILAGHVHDVFPYDVNKRFAVQRRQRTPPAASGEPGMSLVKPPADAGATLSVSPLP